MHSKEITEIINKVWEGVENSKTGKILRGEDTICNLAYQTFLLVLGNIIPKDVSAITEIKEQKENWKE